VDWDVGKKAIAVKADAWKLGAPRPESPTPLETPKPRDSGLWQGFENGWVYWTPNTDAHVVLGAIFAKWGSFGWEQGFLGFPTSDETVAADGVGRFSTFENGVINWSPATGAFEAHGAILEHWRSVGADRSAYGYPISDEESAAAPMSRRSRFQGGSIFWTPSAGAVDQLADAIPADALSSGAASPTSRRERFVRHVLSVKFHEGTNVRIVKNTFVSVAATPKKAGAPKPPVSAQVVKKELAWLNEKLKGLAVDLEPTFGRSEAKLTADRVRAEKLSGLKLSDPNLFQTLVFPEETTVNVAALAGQLGRLQIVESAFMPRVPYPAHVDVAPVTPSFVSNQTYLGPAPLGLGSTLARAIPGGDGANVRIIDVEGAWDLDHEDMPHAAELFFNGTGIDWFGKDHGTAVLGILGAGDDAFGVTGMATGAAHGVNTWASIWGLARAIDDAGSQLRAGDVMLLEVHLPDTDSGSDPFAFLGGNQAGFVPPEHSPDVWDAIRRATARGIIVVEAAGNGSTDLDAPHFGGWFDRSHDSGAIIVGAGNSGDLSPAGFTNHGSRVDVHAWGDSVMTTGYGNDASGNPSPMFRINGNDPHQWYNAGFGGTSSGSALVAAAVAQLQGIVLAAGRPPLTPAQMRDLLVATGTPQAADARPIGPRPNLAAAVARLAIPAPVPPGWPSLGGVLASGPAVGVNADGRIEVFALGTDNRVWHIVQTAANSATWTDWEPLHTDGFPRGRRLEGEIAVGTNDNGRVELFTRADDGTIWHIWQNAPNAGGNDWSGWASLGGTATGTPAVVANADRRLEVFVRWTDATLRHIQQSFPGGGFAITGWMNRGGNLQGSPAASRNQDGRLEVFVRGTGTALQHVAQTSAGGGWTGWMHENGAYSSDPVVATDGAATSIVMEVFLRRSADAVVGSYRQVAPNSAWTPFTPLPNGDQIVAGTRVGVCHDHAGVLHVFARFTDGVGHIHRTPAGWTPWQPLGGHLASDVVPGLNADGRLEVFAVGSDGSLVHRAEPFV
jgi:serine protease